MGKWQLFCTFAFLCVCIFVLLYFCISIILYFATGRGPTKVAAWGKVAPGRGMSLALK